MEGVTKTHIGFAPSKVLNWKEKIVLLGVDGEIAILDSTLEYIQPKVIPFPCKITHACIVDDQLIATWLDYDILIGRMASLPLTQHLSDGPLKSEVRKSTTFSATDLHPHGNSWSHPLNADVLGMVRIDDSIVFALWKRGLYKLRTDAVEEWRAPLPTWPSLEKIPQGNQLISMHETPNAILVVSKGGGFAELSKTDGSVMTADALIENVSISQHYYHQGHHLNITSNNQAIWIDNLGNLVNSHQLSGPVQSAQWNNENNGWDIAGWREVLELSTNHVNSRRLQDICTFVWRNEVQDYLIMNDGSISAIE
jgi:hypothetical protein